MVLIVWQILTVISLANSILACAIDDAEPQVEDSSVDELCQEYNSMAPKLLPNSRNCSLFYECSNGKAVIKQCPANLHFSSSSLVCDYPENAGCQTGTRTGRGRKGGCKQQTVTCPTGSRRSGYAISDPSDCEKFFVCDGGIPHPQTCPSGLHFNSASESCDYPENVECGPSVTKAPRVNLIDENSRSCPATNSKYPVLLPHPEECGKFYICDRGTPILKACQAGLYFNPKNKVCDYPENVQCGKRINKKPREGEADESSYGICPTKNSRQPILLPHPTDCEKFYICDNGKPYLKACQRGLSFNPKIQGCDYPENVNCGKSVSPPPTKGKNGRDSFTNCPPSKSILMPHPERCDKFIMCDAGKSYAKKCPAGLHFSSKLQACDYPNRAQCSKQSIQASVGVPSPFCPSVNGVVPIFYRHPSNCSVYYMCSNGFAYEFVCPARLHFNLRKKVCDYEWLANCRRGDAVNQAESYQ